MRKIFLTLAAAVVIVSCSGPANEQQGEYAVMDMAISELVSDPMEFEGKTVRFEGIIDHMCRHSGDKMRIVQADDNAMSLQVRLGALMDQFSVEAEGSEISVTGVLRTEVLNMEELEQHDEGHDCESTAEAISLMAERGIDPNIRPYVDLQAYEIR